MEITLNYHGALTELFGKDKEIIRIAARTVTELKNELESNDGRFRESTYQLAQDNKIIKGDTQLNEGVIDVFPPFSGG